MVGSGALQSQVKGMFHLLMFQVCIAFFSFMILLIIFMIVYSCVRFYVGVPKSLLGIIFFLHDGLDILS